VKTQSKQLISKAESTRKLSRMWRRVTRVRTLR